MTTITQEQIAAQVKRLREPIRLNPWTMEPVFDELCLEAADMLEQLAAARDCDPDGCYVHIKALAGRAEDTRTYASGVEDAAKMAQNCIYTDSAGTGFDEELFNKRISALLKEKDA